MLIKTFAYPLDFTGAAITNKIVAERQTISPGNGAAFNFFIPKAGPFFGDSLVVRHVASGVELTPGVDFTPSYFFLNASNTANSLRIYGSVTILDTSYAGTFEIDYQTLGGEFTYDEQTLLHILAATQLDPRITNWDAIINHPSLFPPENHLHHVGTSMGYDDLVAAVNNLVQTFTLESGNLMQYVQQHIDDKNNPHLTNLLKLGIQRFENVYIASVAKMLAGTDNLDYATAMGVKAAMDQLHDQIEAEHYLLPNPHGATKSDFNLGQVENWRPATQADAGNQSTNTYVTPSIVGYMFAQAIQQLPIAQITSIEQSLLQHIQNRNNPHGTTTAQLGIGLANFAVGAQGQLPFYNGGDQPFDFTSSMVLLDVAVVVNAAELSAQLADPQALATTIAATHTSQVYVWNGSSYVLSAQSIAAVLLPGRYYRNPLTKRIYFSNAVGSVFLTNGDSGFKDHTKPTVVNDRLVWVDSAGTQHMGTKTVFTYQNPTTGVTTVRGGVDAQVDKLGFTKANGDYYAYFSVADGKMYHYGLQYLSDPTVKQITHELVPVFNTTAVSDLILQTWTWLDDARVPVELHGQVDFGLLTTDVAKYCPRVITKNPDGLETYDQSKLSLVLSIHAHERLSKLDRLAELTPAQLDKLISMLEE